MDLTESSVYMGGWILPPLTETFTGLAVYWLDGFVEYSG